MTQRLAELIARTNSVRELGNVVAAMRSIAAARARESRRMLPGITAYANIIAAAIAAALPLLGPEPPRFAPGRARRTGLIVFGAEQGFVGAFNEAVLHAAEALARPTVLLVAGTRGARLAEERGFSIAWQTAMATQAGAVPATAARLVDALYERMPLEAVSMLFPRWQPNAGVSAEHRLLLPLDPRAFPPRAARQPPLTQMPAPALLERLAEEYVYAQLCEATAHAFAAENEARIAAMARAKSGVDNILGRLEAEQRRVRQEEITAEVVELAMGALAARTPAPRR